MTATLKAELDTAAAELAAAIDSQARAACTALEHAFLPVLWAEVVRAQNVVDRCREYRDGVARLYRNSLAPSVPVGGRLVLDRGEAGAR